MLAGDMAPAQLPYSTAHPMRDRVLAVRGQCRLTTWAWLSMWFRSCSVLADVKPMTCRVRVFQRAQLQPHHDWAATSVGLMHNLKSGQQGTQRPGGL